MPLDRYFTPTDGGFVFTRQQASNFAKGVARDFNPIHDVDAKRFCVPGDLLFAVSLHKLGLSQTMSVKFTDMVNDGVTLQCAEDSNDHFDIQDATGKTYLSVNTQGHRQHNKTSIEQLVQEYVAFSGETFPHVLVPLWKKHGVMVNPNRPLVIYESMSIALETLQFSNIQLELDTATLDVQGRRGNVCLRFLFKDGGQCIGSGEKRMVLSGLKPYDQAVVDNLIEFYDERKKVLATA